jgi:hypothetical protein
MVIHCMNSLVKSNSTRAFDETVDVDGYRIEFVFRRIGASKRKALLKFWEEHRNEWVSGTREAHLSSSLTVESTERARSSAILSNVACLLWSGQQIVGVTWVKVRMTELEKLKDPQMVYFQRMFIDRKHRTRRVANSMFDVFLNGMRHTSHRSPLIHWLLAENANIKLHRKSMRRIFIRKGFEFMGCNSVSNEIWRLRLGQVRALPIRSVYL